MFGFSFGPAGPERSSFRIKRGLDLPIGGRPDQIIFPAQPVGSVAIITEDYVGLRARPLVQVGEAVQLGQPLLQDRRQPDIHFTSPGSGTVSSIEMGPRRAIRKVVIRLEGDAAIEFPAVPEDEIGQLHEASVRRHLLESGLWTCLRTRPFGRIPPPDSEPEAIFVRAIDSNPLAADPAVIIKRQAGAFGWGLQVLARLTPAPLYLCRSPALEVVLPEIENLRVVDFRGPHPSGLVGTHIHHLHPVGSASTVWYLDYQDTIAIGELFRTGRLPTRRIISLAGPGVIRPRLVETRIGCNLEDLLRDQLLGRLLRVISGPVLSGRTAFGRESFLGRYHTQVSVIAEARMDSPTSWRRGRSRDFSWYRLLGLHRERESRFSSALHGRPSSFLPLEVFERVMPLAILVTPLLRALAAGDAEQAAALGCLELEEEDLALCSFLCPGKLEYGLLLRSVLNRIEKEI